MGNNDTLCTIDDEGTCLCHQGKVAHENVCLLHLTCLTVGETNIDLQGCCVVDITLLALFHRVLGLGGVQGVGNKLDQKVTGEVSDRGDFTQHLIQTFLQEPLIGLGLDLHQIGQVEVEAGTGEGLSRVFTETMIFQIDHESNHSIRILMCVDGGRDAVEAY